jgi:hypothetical protein
VTGDWQDLKARDEVRKTRTELGDLSHCSSGLTGRDLGREAKARVGTAFKQNKVNRGSGESKIPTVTEIRVPGRNQGEPMASVVQVARPTNLGQGSFRPLRTVLCLLLGTWYVSEPALAGARGRGPLGTGKY